MPFRSRKQWRWAFATRQPFAKKWAHARSYKRLPTRRRRRKG